MFFLLSWPEFLLISNHSALPGEPGVNENCETEAVILLIVLFKKTDIISKAQICMHEQYSPISHNGLFSRLSTQAS